MPRHLCIRVSVISGAQCPSTGSGLIEGDLTAVELRETAPDLRVDCGPILNQPFIRVIVSRPGNQSA